MSNPSRTFRRMILFISPLVVLSLIILLACVNAWAANETVIYNFAGSPSDGASPYAGLTFGPDGALYGTTYNGGASNAGTVFKLTRTAESSWSETVLYSFGGSPDGAQPIPAMIFGPDGALYGTTFSGGTYNEGTVFKLAPPGGSQLHWTETVLHSFAGGSDGYYPQAGVTFGPDGALYGTTEWGGTSTICDAYPGCGTVFRLARTGGSNWTETVLYRFGGTPDGGLPIGGVTFSWDCTLCLNGALYGTTYLGGTYNQGTVFKLAQTRGNWSETVLYSFGGSPDAARPTANLIFGPEGALYSTTYQGGTSGSGTVFKLAGTGGNWTETVLCSFGGNPDGATPFAGVIFGWDGALYGTTVYGGTYGDGTVFKLARTGRGTWSEAVLYSFTGPPGDGENAWGGVIFGRDGALYGTTYNGGNSSVCGLGCGTVFRLSH